MRASSPYPPTSLGKVVKCQRQSANIHHTVALSGTVFIDRTNRRTAVAAFDGAAAEMQKYKQSVFIFAEGTRSYFDKPDLLPFKKGAFHLAIQAKVPIVPVVVANYSYVLNVTKWIFRSGTIPVKGVFLFITRYFEGKTSYFLYEKLTGLSDSSTTDTDSSPHCGRCGGSNKNYARDNAQGDRQAYGKGAEGLRWGCG